MIPNPKSSFDSANLDTVALGPLDLTQLEKDQEESNACNGTSQPSDDQSKEKNTESFNPKGGES